MKSKVNGGETKPRAKRSGLKKGSELPQPPLVWMFQPHTFEIVTGERLGEWEKMMAEHVGSGEASPMARIPVFLSSGTCSYSHSGPKDSAPDDGDAD